MNAILEQLHKLGAETSGALYRFMDDEQMYLKYIRNFPEEPTMSTLEKAVADKDYPAAERAVHALKGIVIGLGFQPLTNYSVDMLAELNDNNIEDALDAFADLQKQYKIFCDAICAWRDSE